MKRSVPRVALVGAITLLFAGLSATTSTPAAFGQADGGGGGTVSMAELSGPVEPVAGWSGHGPTASESAPSPQTNDGVDGSPVGAESVIGPDGRVQVTNTTSNIARRIGQIEFFQAGQGNFICTGWLIDNNSILTSGHCAFDPHDGGGIIETATWYPGRNGATDPFGGCPVQTVWAPPTEWVINGQPYWDFAVMNFANPGPCQAIGTTLGTFGLMAVANLNGLNRARATVQGYPGDKPDGTMWKMNGRIFKANKRMTFYPMDTAGGQSGSPVWWNRIGGACTGPCGYAVHSYGVGLPGPGFSNNSGPRLTAFRLGQIADIAGLNGS